jgi:uncharacterized membrane protein
MDSKPNTVPISPGGPDLQAAPVMEPSGRVWRGICHRMFDGLMLVLPVLITFWILSWIYSILEKKLIDPMAAVVLWKLKWTTSSDELPYWFETFVAPVIAIILALALLFCLGYFAETTLRRAVDWVLLQVPVISHIYSPVRKVFETLQQQSGQQSSQRLVLISFPHLGAKLPAFVTGSSRDRATNKVILCVYVPTTPVPTSGFFLLVPEEEVTELNWDSQQTLQAIMSGGLIAPPVVSYFKTNTAIANQALATNVATEVRPGTDDQGRSQPT